jgi:hypothetical protein
MGFSGSLGPSHPTIWVTGSMHDKGLASGEAVADSMSLSDCRPASRSGSDSVIVWIEAAGEGFLVLTAVSGGESNDIDCGVKHFWGSGVVAILRQSPVREY